MPSIADVVFTTVGVTPIIFEDARTQFIHATFVKQFKAEGIGAMIRVVAIEYEVLNIYCSPNGNLYNLLSAIYTAKAMDTQI